MNAPLQRVADEVRGIPLADLLAWHGFKLRREGLSFRAKTGRHNIVITGQKWFDNKVGVGGAGAIDLQMHLCGGDFQTTCLVLAQDFRPLVGRLEFPPEKRNRSEPPRATFEELAAKYAVPSSMNWPAARDYLVEARKIDAPLVDNLHEAGAIYANTHYPSRQRTRTRPSWRTRRSGPKCHGKQHPDRFCRSGRHGRRPCGSCRCAGSPS